MSTRKKHPPPSSLQIPFEATYLISPPPYPSSLIPHTLCSVHCHLVKLHRRNANVLIHLIHLYIFLCHFRKSTSLFARRSTWPSSRPKPTPSRLTRNFIPTFTVKSRPTSAFAPLTHSNKSKSKCGSLYKQAKSWRPPPPPSKNDNDNKHSICKPQIPFEQVKV